MRGKSTFRFLLSLIGIIVLTGFNELHAFDLAKLLFNLPQSEMEPDPTPYGDTLICTIPFIKAGNLILIEADAGIGNGHFILDTGAPRLVLNLTYFRDVKAREMTTAGGVSGGISQLMHTNVAVFKVGNYNYKNIDADVVPLGHIEDHIGVKVLGLIGVNMLKNFTMLIDYKSSTIKIKMLKRKDKFCFHSLILNKSDTFQTMQMRIFYNKLIVPGIMSGKKLSFIIDTGAESNIIDSRLPDNVLEKINVTGRILLSGSSNKKVEALNGNAAGLSLSGISIQSLPVIVTNLKDMCLAFDFCIDGMLGFDFLSLHTIEINFVQREMYLWN